MKTQCNFCGNWISDTDETCPNCGAINENCVRGAKEAPKTIEELKTWYTAHNLPPEEVTRFFIGKNYTQPKAFGIYEENGEFIVYKNKADGTRAVRYQGRDEAYAVNELYQKLKEEIANQKARNGHNGGNRNSGGKKNGTSPITYFLIALACIFLIGFISVKLDNSPSRGYYRYQDDVYYYLNDWYIYDYSYNNWSYTSVDSELSGNADTYYESSTYSSSYGVSDFEYTSYYQDWQSSSWDDDSSWDSSDSWDSGSTDWGSDW